MDFLERHGKRESNFELLRILAMMMIVCGHLVSQGLCPNYSAGYNLHISIAFISSMSRIAVSIFLLIGTYFMVDTSFKANRILNLYGQLAFWIILLSWGGY